MAFIQPPFWSHALGRYPRQPHAIAVLVTPDVAIVSSSIANQTVLATSVAHGLATGDTVTIAGHAGSTPDVNGSRRVTVLSQTAFSVVVPVTIAGTGGTVTRTAAAEPLTLDEGKLRAGQDWDDDDARDALMSGFISAARSKVEQDTGLALLAQTHDLYYDAVPWASWTQPIALPDQSRPLQAVLSFKSTDTGGVSQTLDPAQYVVDVASGRIGLALGGLWPIDVRPFQPFVIRIVSGWSSVAQIPPLLVHGVGLMTAHYATAGRDVAEIMRGVAIEMPYGYDDAIGPYQLLTLA